MRALSTVLLLLLHQHASALLLPTLRARAPRMDTQWSSPSYSSPASSGGSPSPAELCAALQNGEARVAGLDEALSGTKTARPFFDAYLTGDEWTCADAEAPPRPLAASIANATDEGPGAELGPNFWHFSGKMRVDERSVFDDTHRYVVSASEAFGA